MIKLTFLKGTVQWYSILSCVTITINLKMLLSPSRRNSVPISNHFSFLSPIPPPTSNYQFLSLWICVFWTFSFKEANNTRFWDWLLSLKNFSRCVHVAACISSSFHCIYPWTLLVSTLGC